MLPAKPLKEKKEAKEAMEKAAGVDLPEAERLAGELKEWNDVMARCPDRWCYSCSKVSSHLM